MSQATPYAHCLDWPDWLLSPEHAARMGGALWVYLWLWRESPVGDDPRRREVRGGATWRTTEIGEALGLQERTVRRHLATLCQAGYLVTSRAGQGLTGYLTILGSALLTQKNADNSVRSLTRERPNLSDQPDRADNSVRYGGQSGQICPIENPPAPPIRVLEESFLDSCSYEGFLEEPTTAKKAQIVPFPGSREAGASRTPAVAAGQISGRLRHEQTVTHLLSRIEAWERPALTRTLLDALCSVPLEHLGDVFDQAWRISRGRDKGQHNPAGWWASTLCRCADACKAALKGAHGYG